MLPASWRVELEARSSSSKGKRPRQEPVKDIQMWAECFSVYAMVLLAVHPEKAPYLLAYMHTIVQASHKFGGHSYDMTFWCTAANQGSLDCGVPNPGIYDDAFTGVVKSWANCFYCLDAYLSADCPEAPEFRSPTTHLPSRSTAVHAAMLTSASVVTALIE